ncbi:hypothetical protein ABI59_21395 [Acidobacteria bacterium Mor1]|nr:hypothetical protein ABI59_21395 [Acidobacteria bacterium Mor1]
MSFPFPGRILPIAPGTFRALRHRNFRLLWLGQGASLMGSWMQSTAQGWLVLRLTDSPFMLGVVGFCTFSPVLLFGLVAGVTADRVPRRAALLWTQGTMLAMAAILTVLTALGRVEAWHVALLAFGVGTAGAFDIPIRQSLLQDLVGREDLPNAIALNSLAFNGARLAGPAVAGLLLTMSGEALVFGLNAASYLAILVSLMLIRLPATTGGDATPPQPWVASMLEGLRFALRTPPVRVILGLVVISSIFGSPYTILMPVFARDVLDAGARGLGLLMGASGMGATFGALYLAQRTTSRRSGGIIARALALFGASLIAFALSTSFGVSVALLTLVGGGLMVQMATSNTLLQLMSPAHLRGRIISLYMLAFVGMAPFGSLLAGTVARRFGASWSVGIGGTVCLLAAAWFATRLPGLRRAAQQALSNEA